MASVGAARRAARTVTAIAIVAILLSVAFGTLAGLASVGSATVNPATGSWTTIDAGVSEVPNDVTVRATRENAIHVNRTSISSDVPQNLTNSSWTVCAAAHLDEAANTDAAYDVVAYENETVVLQYDDGDWVGYFNSSTADGKVTLAAPGAQAGFVPVCVRWNDDTGTLTLLRNGTTTTTTGLTSSPTSRNLSVDWHGRLDEVRAFRSAVSDSEVSKWASDPILPLPGTDRAARFMFDEGSGTSTTVFFAGTSVSLGSATWTGGITKAALDAGTDYRLQSGPFALLAVSGGDLDGAPIAYVSWADGPFGGFLQTIENIGAAALTLLALSIVVGAAAAVSRHLDEF